MKLPDILKEIITAVITIPLLWVLIRYILSNLSRQISELKVAVGKTVLEDDIIIDYARTKVWYASEVKLKFIRERLTKNHLRDRTEEVKKSITSELERRTEEYIEYLNRFNTRVGLVWDYIRKNFEWDSFIWEIFDVVFKQPKKDQDIQLCNEYKINDIRFIMTDYQTRLFRQMYKDLKKSNLKDNF